MKTLLAICALALTVGYVQAQTTAGKMMIGGTVEYTSTKNEALYGDSKVNSLNLSPQFGYFVADNVAIGLMVDFYRENGLQLDPLSAVVYDMKYTTTTFSPFVRYYIFTPNEKFAFYAQAGAGIGFTKVDYDQNDDERNGRSFSVHVSPGFSYFLSEKWALDLQLHGISYTLADPDTDSDTENDKITAFSFGVSSFQPQLGFRFFFGK